jgi:hypothetical protein
MKQEEMKLPDLSKMRHVKQRFVPAMRLDQLDALSFNPDSRSSPSALADLRASIHDNGVLDPLWVAEECKEGQNVIIDGHRRYSTAIEFGMATVPILLCLDTCGLTARQLFNILNGATRPHSSLDWMEVWVKFHEDYGVPRVQLRHLKTAEKLFGPLDLLIAARVAPSVASEAIKRAKELEALVPGHGLTARRIGLWFVEHGTQRITREVIRHRMASGAELPLRRLLRAIRKNIPCSTEVYAARKPARKPVR